MLLQIRKLIKHRDLFSTWTSRELKVRYKQSFLGVTWALLQPLSLTLLFSFVFSIVVPVDTGGIPYPVFAYTAILPWTFFSTSISFSVSSLINNLNLVTKIYFPREIIPLANVAAAFVDFLIASVVFIGMMIFYQVEFYWTFFWVLPLVLLETMLIVGISLLGSAVMVFFRDLRFVVPLGLQLWMYATPIIYPIELVPEKFQSIYKLNPMVGIIEGYRQATLYGQNPNLSNLIPSAVIVMAIFFEGFFIFKRLEPAFADVI